MRVCNDEEKIELYIIIFYNLLLQCNNYIMVEKINCRGFSRKKEWGCLSEVLSEKKPIRGTRILFCRSGLKYFQPLTL